MQVRPDECPIQENIYITQLSCNWVLFSIPFLISFPMSMLFSGLCLILAIELFFFLSVLLKWRNISLTQGSIVQVRCLIAMLPNCQLPIGNSEGLKAEGGPLRHFSTVRWKVSVYSPRKVTEVCADESQTLGKSEKQLYYSQKVNMPRLFV